MTFSIRPSIYLTVAITFLVLLIVNEYMPLVGVYQELKMYTQHPDKAVPTPTPSSSSSSSSSSTPRRVALCISGQFRYLSEVASNHLIFLRSLRLTDTVDVFICAEDDLDATAREHVMTVYQPVSVRWDAEPVEPLANLSANNVKMFRRIYLCDQLRQQRETTTGAYDVVIRMRPDLIFFHAFSSGRLLPGRIYFPMHTKQEPLLYGLPDLLFWGDSDTMKVMCECYLALNHLHKLFSCLNEYIFMNYMVSRGLIARKVVFPVNLFDRNFYTGRSFFDKYIKGKWNYISNGAKCYQNNDYDLLVIEEDE